MTKQALAVSMVISVALVMVCRGPVQTKMDEHYQQRLETTIQMRDQMRARADAAEGHTIGADGQSVTENWGGIPEWAKLTAIFASVGAITFALAGLMVQEFKAARVKLNQAEHRAKVVDAILEKQEKAYLRRLRRDQRGDDPSWGLWRSGT
jgi:hypothetical protein